MARKRQQTAEAPGAVEFLPVEPAAAAEAAASAPPPEETQPQPEKPQRDFRARRSWTEQYSGPLQYEMFTAGKSIMFRFKLPKGQDKPSEEALEVMRSHKQTPEGQLTGLRFEDTRMHGKVWTLPNDAEGRELAVRIDMELSKLAKKMESTPPLPA